MRRIKIYFDDERINDQFNQLSFCGVYSKFNILENAKGSLIFEDDGINTFGFNFDLISFADQLTLEEKSGLSLLNENKP